MRREELGWAEQPLLRLKVARHEEEVPRLDAELCAQRRSIDTAHFVEQQHERLRFDLDAVLNQQIGIVRRREGIRRWLSRRRLGLGRLLAKRRRELDEKLMTASGRYTDGRRTSKPASATGTVVDSVNLTAPLFKPRSNTVLNRPPKPEKDILAYYTLRAPAVRSHAEQPVRIADAAVRPCRRELRSRQCPRPPSCTRFAASDLPDSERAKRRAVQLALVRISTCAASPWRPRRREDMAHAARATTGATGALASSRPGLAVARALAPLHGRGTGPLIARGTAVARGRPRTHRMKASAGAIDTARGAAAVIARRRRSGGYARRRSGTEGRRCAMISIASGSARVARLPCDATGSHLIAAHTAQRRERREAREGRKHLGDDYGKHGIIGEGECVGMAGPPR